MVARGRGRRADARAILTHGHVGDDTRRRNRAGHRRLRARERCGRVARPDLRDRALRGRPTAWPPSPWTSPTRATRCRTSCWDDLIAAFEAARDDDAVRCVVLASTHEKTFSSGGNLAGFAADVPLVHKHVATERFPRLFTLIGELGKPVDLRGQRPLPGRGARARAGLRPDRRQRGGDLRHARDQRRRLPVHDPGADRAQRAAQEGDRAAAARRAHRRARGRAPRDRQPRRGGRGVRRGRRATGRSGSPASRRCS